MHSFFSNFMNETQKAITRKKTIVFLSLMFIMPVGAAGLMTKFQFSAGVSIVSLSTFQSLLLELLTSILLPLLVFQMTGDLFAGESGDKTIKAVLLRPVSRFKVYSSKQLTIVLFVALYLFAAWLGSVTGGLLWMHSEITGSSMWGSFVLYAISLPPLVALTTIGSFIAQFFKSGSGALAFSILLFITCKIVAFVFPSYSTFLVTSYTDWYSWIGSAMTAGKTVNAFLFLLASSMIVFTAGFVLFDRKEF